MSNWKVEEEQILPKGENPLGNPFYGYRKIGLLLPDGRQATYHGLVVPECVHVVAVHDDETTFLVRQSRPNVMSVGATKVPETLELPGGFRNPNKSLEDSAQEELEEEIGLHADIMIGAGSILPSVGVSNERDHIFLGRELTPTTQAASDEATEQDMRIVSDKFGKLYDQILREKLPVSAQTVAALAKVAILL